MQAENQPEPDDQHEGEIEAESKSGAAGPTAAPKHAKGAVKPLDLSKAPRIVLPAEEEQIDSAGIAAATSSGAALHSNNEAFQDGTQVDNHAQGTLSRLAKVCIILFHIGPQMLSHCLHDLLCSVLVCL